MPTLYAVRLTCSAHALWEDEDESFGQYLSERFETVIVYEHIGTVNENVHCHLLLRANDQAPTADAMRKSPSFKKLNLGSREHSFKQTFKDKQTKQVYDMTDAHVNKYIVYMSKGVLDPEYVSPESLWDWKRCVDMKDGWVVPKSVTATKVAAFETYLGDEKPPYDVKDADAPYKWLKNKVMSYIMNKYDGFDVTAANECKMLLVTFMWKRGFVWPDKSKQYV